MPDSAQNQVRYRAHFTPEAWVNDNAVEVDAEGEQSWDCTRAVNAHADYFNRLETSGHNGSLDDDLSGLLDNDDVLREDQDAPEWVRNWRGPFSIHVFRQVPDGA